MIVFDDLHRVPPGPMHTPLDTLIQRLPARWTLAIASRVAPRTGRPGCAFAWRRTASAR